MTASLAHMPRWQLIVISCGGAKLARRARAQSLYTGSIFKASLRAARRLAEGDDDRIRILSAMHGLVGLRDELDPYDLSMGDEGSVSVETVRAQAEAQGLASAVDVIVLAPRRYCEVACAVWPDARTPLVNAARGKQMRILKAIADA